MDLHEFIQIWRRRFQAASLVFILLLSGFVVLAKYERNADETIQNFIKLRTNISRIRMATVEMEQILKTYKGLVPPDYEKKTHEAQLYDWLDKLKARFPVSEFKIEAPRETSESISVPFNIKISGYSFTTFLNELGLIQTGLFPFVSTTSISISAEIGEMETNNTIGRLNSLLKASSGIMPKAQRGGVVYTIQGSVSTPKMRAYAP